MKGMGMQKWKGLQAPTRGGLKAPDGGKGKATDAIGDFKLGRRTKSKKYKEVFGG